MGDSGGPGLLGRIPPAAWFFVLLAKGWALERWHPLPVGWTSLGWQLGTALVLFGGAAAFAGWSIVLFQAKGTTVVPFGTPATLVTSGPFRLSRNPLYVALAVTLAAFGVLLDSVWFVLLAAVLVLVLDSFVVREEERRLRERFGEEFEKYARRVRRWL